MRAYNRTLHALVFLVVLGPALQNAFAGDTVRELPPACRTDCKSAYGSVLGKSPEGIAAYSNCQSGCVIFEPNHWRGTYTGIKWQCVEYARRWLLISSGAVFGDVDIAADIWDKIDHLTDSKTAKPVPLASYLNGSKQAPEVGDLLIYAREFKNTGHVAVVTGIDIQDDTLEVSEQNFDNEPWTHRYARKIKFIRNDGNYWLLDGYLLGWKHATIKSP